MLVGPRQKNSGGTVRSDVLEVVAVPSPALEYDRFERAGGDWSPVDDAINTNEQIVFSMENVTTRMTEEELALVEQLADETGVSRSDAIRQALRRGANGELVELALQRYQDGEIGMRGATVLAGLSIGDLMAEANQRGISTNYEAADLADDVDALR